MHLTEVCWSRCLRIPIDAENLPPLLDGSSQIVQHCLGILPVNAGVGDAHAVFQS